MLPPHPIYSIRLDYILQTKDLTKNYGHIVAVKNLSLTIKQGNVFGILGPNGSGKTTTLSIITGVIQQGNGEYSWFGQKPASRLRKRIGSLIEVPHFYPYLSLQRNLQIVASIKEVPEGDIDRVLQLTGLFERRTSAFSTLSLGMKQRLALAAVLLGDPEVLVLDEPANGLDPEGIAEVRAIIQREAEKNKTIIMASHILDEVEKVCSHVAVLKKGESIAQGRVHELLAEDEPVIISADNLSVLEEEIIRSGMTLSVNKDNNDLIVILKKDYQSGDLNKFAFSKGFVLSKLVTRKKSLESQFLELVK